MDCANKAALQLPDSLLVRYFRAGTIEEITKVDVTETGIRVRRGKGKNAVIERFRDLGGGLGFVPEVE